MSRIGNAPITIPKSVKIKTEGQTIAVEGPKGKLSFDVPNPITFKLEGDVLSFSRPNDRAGGGLTPASLREVIADLEVQHRAAKDELAEARKDRV